MDIKNKLRNQRLKKYALIALTIIVVVGALASLSIEGKNSKIEDGQGNIVVDNMGDVLTDSDGIVTTSTPDELLIQDNTTGEDSNSPDANVSESSSKKTVREIVEDAKTADDIELTEKQKEETTAEEIKVDNTSDMTASNGGNKALRPETPQNVTVTLEIRCDTLSSHMEYLENESIRDYIPKDGTILARTSFNGTTENTVFDVLNTLTRNNDIQLEFSYTPLYESYYIEGINYLYEFDGGPQSGWMYKVNEWFPNYGCSSYYLSNGDEIVFCYTCRGLGEDVGNSYMGSM